MSEQMDAVLLRAAIFLKISGNNKFNPIVSKSKKWIKWVTNFGQFTCAYCAEQNGKVFNIQKPPPIEPPVHINCNCLITALLSILAGMQLLTEKLVRTTVLKISKLYQVIT